MNHGHLHLVRARQDRPAVEVLARDLERTRESVWMDNELTGGQAWWDTILSQIRACDLYVLALSPESLRSRACRLELQYALAVRRPLLPVQISDVAISTAPQAVADTRSSTTDSGPRRLGLRQGDQGHQGRPQAHTNRSTITAARVVAWILVAFWLVVLLYAFLVAATY